MLDTVRLVEQWAVDRNLIHGSTLDKQLGKLREEVDEIEDALEENDQEALVDAIGDCTVVLTILAAQAGYSLDYCFRQAYNEIKDRRGRMIDGIFVKEQDFEKLGITS